MRNAALIAVILLAACSRGAADGGSAAGAKQAEFTTIPCALGGAAQFAKDCALEQTKVGKDEVWIVHHPDGGFRRFQIIDNGTRIATADGAWEVQAQRVGAELEVKVADDRYRFPAAPEPKVAASDAPHP